MTELAVPVLVRDLADADLPGLDWSGGPLHVKQIAIQLERVRAGDAEYLAVCGPAGLPIGIGAVDYVARPGAGTLWQLAVHPAMRSCGIGAVLIGAAEDRIHRRGIKRAELSVEQNNPRAQALYERLGYRVYGTEDDAWDQEAEDGSVYRYETVCNVMAKRI
jgi:ribosomal protein S18 acetylase RimI-like enzyme